MASQISALLVSDAVSLPASLILSTLRSFEENADGSNRLAVITQASYLVGKLKFETSSLSAVFSLAENNGFHSVLWLSELARILQPGGVLLVQEPRRDDEITKSDLERNLLLAGYINVQQCPKYAEDGNFCIAVTAVKPTWETGVSFSLKKSLVAPQGGGNEANLGGISVPFSGGSAGLKLPTYEDDSAYDFVDEDTLLAEDDLKRPELPDVDDCEVGKAGRKACKNCSCGRANMEQAGKLQLTAEQLNNPQSACGSCGLGDAFRCGACPYKGLPPFKLREKITLSGAILTADV